MSSLTACYHSLFFFYLFNGQKRVFSRISNFEFLLSERISLFFCFSQISKVSKKHHWRFVFDLIQIGSSDGWFNVKISLPRTNDPWRILSREYVKHFHTIFALIVFYILWKIVSFETAYLTFYLLINTWEGYRGTSTWVLSSKIGFFSIFFVFSIIIFPFLFTIYIIYLYI